MEIIKTPVVVEKFGLAIRLIKDSCYKDRPYGVEFAPLYSGQPFKFKRIDFSCFGGGVGMSDSYFRTLKKAKEFFNDIINLSREEMLKKYPDIWVE